VTTDSDIIRSSATEPSRFGELFDRHARKIHRYAASRTNSQVAEDLVGDTFLVAFERRARFDHTWSNAAPWLLGIATVLIRKHRSAEAKNFRAMERIADPLASELAESAAAGRAEASLAMKRLARAIRDMSDDDRDTLLLFAWGDLTYEEISIAMDVPVGTVRSRLNRARRILKLADADNPIPIGGIDGPDRAIAPSA
jgi:RNA polymerase sigma factor (sigma-70 family)